MTNLELVKDYLDRECLTTIRYCNDIDNGFTSFWKKEDKKDLVEGTIQRCYGVVMFAQDLDGVDYEDVASIYEDYRKKLEKLLTR